MSELNKRQRNERKRARRRRERMRHFQIPPEVTHKIEKMPPEKALPEPDEKGGPK